MSNLIAKPVVKNKFWIVERDNGSKVATIQVATDGVVFVNEQRREKFPSVKSLGTKYNIKFDKAFKTPKKVSNEIYGYPTDGPVSNPLYDIKRKLPIYTKTKKSKSYFCAGYYLIKMNENWVEAFCPKLITLNRHPFKGPFLNKQQIKEVKKDL
ncbi:MAG: hypothetical protein N2235_05370 [Fischerella sp.]|nr:hypothetical protein [Fischerella sp.]